MTAPLSIRRIGFTCADLDRTAAFYAGLGFRPIDRSPVPLSDLQRLNVAADRAERLRLRLGRQEVEFIAFDPPGRPYPQESTSTDLWFQHIAVVVADMGEACRQLGALEDHTPITRGGPQTLPANTGGVAAFKFRDPDGHPLEFLAFPAGVGDPSWGRQAEPSLFLGIDHSAMAVGDLTSARTFYEGLGFRQTTSSLNQGPEQDRLDDVDGDVVDVVGLRAAPSPPHLELLAYRTGTRRAMPTAHNAADIAGTRLILSGAGPRGVTCDPDGHLVLFEEGP